MPVANNMAQLNAMLAKEINKAMGVVSEKVLADMYEETGKFYTQGNPKIYERTGALGDSPKVTPLTAGKTSGLDFFQYRTYFDAYLDQTHKYLTGTFDMATVLARAETNRGWYRAGILGKPQFWNRSEKKMEKTLNRVMRSFFSRY